MTLLSCYKHLWNSSGSKKEVYLVHVISKFKSFPSALEVECLIALLLILFYYYYYFLSH